MVSTRNHESDFQHQQDLPYAGDCTVPGITNILESVPDTSTRPDGHALTDMSMVVNDREQRRVTVCQYTINWLSLRDDRSVLGKKLDEILKWLDALNCAEKQDIILSLRQPDTCKWLFATSQYKSWRDGQGSFLWLHGKCKVL